MITGKWVPGLVCLAALTASSCKSLNKPVPDPAHAAAPQLSPEEMMAMMQKLAAPSDGHRLLAPLAGTFRTRGEFWMQPGAPPTVAEGRSVNEWIMDGRFLQQRYESLFMEAPFIGMGLTGFNNETGQYEGTWIDNMSTFIMPMSTGTADPSGQVITFRRRYSQPGMNVILTSREVITIHDDDHHTFEWFDSPPDGKELQSLRIEYTREK